MNTFIVEIKNGRITEWYRIEITKDNTIRSKKLNEDVYTDLPELLKGFKKVLIEYDSPLIDALKNMLCKKSKKKCLSNVYQMEEREKKRTFYEFESGIIEKDSNPTLKKRSDGKKNKKKSSFKKRSRRDGVLSRVTSPRRSPVRRRQPDVIDLTDDSEERRQK